MKTKLSLLVIAIMFGLATPHTTSAQEPVVDGTSHATDKATDSSNDDDFFLDPTFSYDALESILATFGVSSDKQINRFLKKQDRYYKKRLSVVRKFSKKSKKGVDTTLVKSFLSDMNLYIGGKKFASYQPSEKLIAAFTPEALDELATIMVQARKSIKEARKTSGFKAKMKTLFPSNSTILESEKSQKPGHKLLFLLFEELFAHITIPGTDTPVVVEYDFQSLPDSLVYSTDDALAQEYIEQLAKSNPEEAAKYREKIARNKEKVAKNQEAIANNQEEIAKIEEQIARDQQIFENGYTLSPEQIVVSEIPYTGLNQTIISRIEATDKYTKVTFVIPIHHQFNWFLTSYGHIQDVATGDKYHIRHYEREIPMGRIIIIKDNEHTMTELTAVYPPLKKGVQFIKVVEDDPKGKIELPSNAASTGEYSIIDLAIYYPERYPHKKPQEIK